jgi:hypothetical protein
VLDGEESAGAAQSGLHLVGDEQGAMPAAQIGGRFEIVVGRHGYGLALDRLDDEGGDVA